MSSAGNIATYVRIRPFVPQIEESNILTAFADVEKDLIVHRDHLGDENNYQFTKVFNQQHKTKDVFETAMKPLLVQKILQGINAVFMVYGQCGSGKSFTLVGEDTNLGLLPMALKYLLSQRIVQINDIEIRCIEAYGIKPQKIAFYDLVKHLNEKTQLQKINKKFDVYRRNGQNNTQAQYIKITEQNCFKIITELQNASHMASTLKSPHSSRGHTVYFCKVYFNDKEVQFVAADLAG
eukprot:291026_1